MAYESGAGAAGFGGKDSFVFKQALMSQAVRNMSNAITSYAEALENIKIHYKTLQWTDEAGRKFQEVVEDFIKQAEKVVARMEGNKKVLEVGQTQAISMQEELLRSVNGMMS